MLLKKRVMNSDGMLLTARGKDVIQPGNIITYENNYYKVGIIKLISQGMFDELFLIKLNKFGLERAVYLGEKYYCYFYNGLSFGIQNSVSDTEKFYAHNNIKIIS